MVYQGSYLALTCDKALTCGFFISRRAIDLSRQKQPSDRLGFQRTSNLKERQVTQQNSNNSERQMLKRFVGMYARDRSVHPPEWLG